MLIGKIYNTLIKKHRDAISFIVLFFFVVSFILSRIYIYLNALNIIPDRFFLNRNVRGVHIHHMAFGIIILTMVGYISLYVQNKKFRHVIAAFYGIGLGLAYDEFGMWLMLKDNYWIRQSYDAIAIIAVVLINIVYFNELWQKIFLKTITLVLRFTHKYYARFQRISLLRLGRAKSKQHQF